MRTAGKLVIDTPDDAIALVNVLLRERPLDEVVAAIDLHGALLPPGFDRVRAAAARGDPGAAGSALMVALDPRGWP